MANKNTNQFILFTTFKAQPGKGEELFGLLADAANYMRTYPGCEEYRVKKSALSWRKCIYLFRSSFIAGITNRTFYYRYPYPSSGFFYPKRGKTIGAEFWLILGALLLLNGLVLAHLSNANLIHWSYGRIADVIFHKAGLAFILIGIVITLVKRFRK